jgi:PAS domain S-box-containing protein
MAETLGEEGPRLTLAGPEAWLLETIVGALGDGITVQEASGRLVYANDHAAQTLGFADAGGLLAASPEEIRARYELIDDYGRPIGNEDLPGRRALLEGVADQRLVRFRIRGGPERVSLVRASPILGEDGITNGCVNVFRDVTERHQANEGLRLLAETGALLAGSLDWETTLQGVARLAVPTFADWCIVDVIEGEREIRRVATAAANPREEQLLDELREHYSPTWDSPQPASRALRAAEPVVIEQFDRERLAETVRDDRHLELMTELDPQSAIALPLVARGQTLGAVTFAWSRSGRRYEEADIRLAEELARRAALAIDNARLFRGEQEARERLAFLAEASAALAGSLDYERTLERVAKLAVPRLADWCVIDVLETDEVVRRVGVACADPAKDDLAEQLRQSYPERPERPEGTSKVLRSGESELIPQVTPEWIAAIAPDPEQHRILSSLGLVSNILVPLSARGRILGVLALATAESGRVYGEAELSVAEDLGRRAAVAVDNARLYHEAEARGEAARALAYVADGVLLVDSGGVVRHWNPAAEAITGVAARDVLGRQATDALPGWSGIAARVPVAEGPASPARPETLPLELRGGERWLSISAVAFAEGTVYAFRDLTEERALERLRSDFVSTVSHELRTPLAAIYGAALTLRRPDVVLPEVQREGLLDVIAGESDRLARTVNDILWASRLDSGTMQVAIERCDPRELGETVLQAFRAHVPTAVELALVAPADGPAVAADPDKVRQVLANLVDNAVKYSPDGGRVEIAVSSAGNHVRFAVRDQGLGIPGPEQRRIFDKFYRLDPDLTRGVGGTGLGLYICRELVRRMDGRIWVESREGEGSTFSFELPAA